jgi:glycosyltransferase involved in cell wall biosynthesis
VLGELSGRLAIASRAPVPAERVPPGPAAAPAAGPKVLVLTPVKNARAHLRTYFALLDRLDRGGARLSIGLLESDSSDGSYEALVAAAPSLHRTFEAVTLMRHDYGFHPEGHRSSLSFQRRRREILARSRNRLLSGALRDEDWVLWLDADLVDYPADLLTRMLAAGRDIATPHCVRPDGTPFDLNTFRFSPESGGQDDPQHIHDGLFQPPRGAGRLYLDAFTDREQVEVDSVGGTALLVRADLHREGLNFPPYSYRGYIETEGLAMMARDMGVASWALPQLRIVHANT